MDIKTYNFLAFPATLRRLPMNAPMRFRQSTTYDRGSLEVFGRKNYSDAEIQEAVEYLNNAMNPFDRKVEFHKHVDSGKTFVRVINPLTDEIIREITPEKEIEQEEQLKEISGLIIDRQV